uniref:Uncharacterized protein n=1 Tax=Octopus bimaculoides TaxID=37653 RepID=A0A0L8G9W0_OCTBM
MSVSRLLIIKVIQLEFEHGISSFGFVIASLSPAPKGHINYSRGTESENFEVNFTFHL